MSVVVTQADRQAAADYGVALGWQPNVIADVREGRRDYWPTVRAFARQRTEATEELVAALAEARDCIACDNGFNAADGREPGAWTAQDAEELAARIDAAIARARGEQA